VDVERINIYGRDPLVSDPTGPIFKYNYNPFTGVTTTERFREDPYAALQQAIAFTLAKKKENSTASKIDAGKVGNTTSTFYTVNATYEDGSIGGRTTGTYITWSSLVGVVGQTILDDDIFVLYEHQTADGNGFSDLYRGRVTFRTEPIGDSDTISSATLSLSGAGRSGSAYGVDINVFTFNATPGSDSALATADFEKMRGTSVSTAVSHASWSSTASADNNFSLDATGLSAISKTGTSYFSLMATNDGSTTTPPTTGGNYQGYIWADTIEDGGGNVPVLVVEHTGGAAAVVPEDIILFD
jgi:hypothetical protein